jgi:hypothetical protein
MRYNFTITDVSDGSLFGGPDAPEGSVTVAIADMTYDGRDHSDAMRKRAIRHAGGKHGRIVRRWRWYDCPAATVLVLDPDRDKAFS